MLRTLHGIKLGSVEGVVSKLKKRKTIHIHGKDTIKFLQGMTTNKILSHIEYTIDGQYGGWLTGQGRLLFDTFFYLRSQNRTSYLIDVDVDCVDLLVEHIEKFKLRSKIYVEPEIGDAYSIWCVAGRDIPTRDKLLKSLLNRSDLGYSMTVAVDPRFPLFIRVIIPFDAVPPLEGLDLFWENENEEDLYRYLRILHGIPEGQSDLPYEKQIPLEANMYELGGVSKTKGCYVGQELVTRTLNRGSVNKRIFPLRKMPLFGENPPIKMDPENLTLIPDGLLDNIGTLAKPNILPEDMKIVEAITGKRSGVVHAIHENLILGSVRMEHLNTTTNPNLLFKVGDEELQVILPEWYPKIKN